jgi:hypothetical protein
VVGFFVLLAVLGWHPDAPSGRMAPAAATHSTTQQEGGAKP